MSRPRINKFQGADGQHYWSLIDSNGEIIAVGEGYTRAHDRDRAIANVKEAWAALDQTEDEQS